MLNEPYLRKFIKKHQKHIDFIDVGLSDDWNTSACYWGKQEGYNQGFVEIKQKLDRNPTACVKFSDGEILTFACKKPNLKEKWLKWFMYQKKNEPKIQVTSFEHQRFIEMMGKALSRHIEDLKK